MSYSEAELRIRDVAGYYLWCRVRATTQFDGESRPIKRSFRASDLVGRIGGDEFLVYLPEVRDADAALAKAGQVLRDFCAITPADTPIGSDEENVTDGRLAQYVFRTLYAAGILSTFLVKLRLREKLKR